MEQLQEKHLIAVNSEKKKKKGGGKIVKQGLEKVVNKR